VNGEILFFLGLEWCLGSCAALRCKDWILMKCEAMMQQFVFLDVLYLSE